jgi:hypothetical protein
LERPPDGRLAGTATYRGIERHGELGDCAVRLRGHERAQDGFISRRNGSLAAAASWAGRNSVLFTLAAKPAPQRRNPDAHQERDLLVVATVVDERDDAFTKFERVRAASLHHADRSARSDHVNWVAL